MTGLVHIVFYNVRYTFFDGELICCKAIWD